MRSIKSAANLRIVGGCWRGRRLRFDAVAGLRPTPDRLRETLFNWLLPVIDGARCLDLFAGSGALGIEALSRGAAEVVFVERDPRVGQRLRNNLDLLQAAGAQVACTDALRWLRAGSNHQPFDIALLDPPFDHDLLAPSCALLHHYGWLRNGAYIYLEANRQTALQLPSGWSIIREKTAGQICYRLATFTGSDKTDD